MDGYCPFDIIKEPALLGLEEVYFGTAYGQMRVVHRLESAGPLTVFLHGVGGTWASWTPLIQAAAQVSQDLGSVALVDLPGFGKSENLLESLDSKEVGEALVKVAHQLGYTTFRVVGQSMGAFLALDMAATQPDAVTHVTALAGSFQSILRVAKDPIAFAARHPLATTTNVLFFLAGRTGGGGRALASVLRRLGASSLFDGMTAHPDQLRESVKESLAQGFAIKNFAKAALNGRKYDALERWSAIQVPMSFVWGEHDPIVPPAEQDVVRARLPKARGFVVLDAAHIMHIERPVDVLPALFPV